MVKKRTNRHHLSRVQAALFKVLQHVRNPNKIHSVQGNKSTFAGELREVLGCRWVCIEIVLIVTFNSAVRSEHGGQLIKQPSSSLGIKDHFFQGGHTYLDNMNIGNIGALRCDA